MVDIAGLCNALADDCDEGENNYWENGDWRCAADTLRQAAAKITDLRAALVSIRDIEKPMFGEQPERDWLAWYSTASQMAELADDALITAKPERDE